MDDNTIDAEIIPSEIITSNISSLGDVMTTAQLKASTKKAQEQRAIITVYVRDHLVEGVDYGKIGSFKKNVLFKPGQEKIFSLMNLTSRLEKDADTIEMLGHEPGIIAYICRVYRKGDEIAQGRGAAKVGENSRDINSTIKIAEKRARMDACLSLGFSEFFTQDLDDPDYQPKPSSQSPAPTPKYVQEWQIKFLLSKSKEISGLIDKAEVIKWFVDQVGVAPNKVLATDFKAVQKLLLEVSKDVANKG